MYQITAEDLVIRFPRQNNGLRLQSKQVKSENKIAKQLPLVCAIYHWKKPEPRVMNKLLSLLLFSTESILVIKAFIKGILATTILYFQT